MSISVLPDGEKFDRTNAFIGAVVFLLSFVVYALTVQPTFSFWDCGEFIACAYILGIPHPPGTPVFVLLGRVISLIPFVDDISYRINYISVVSSAFTALFSYLLTVRLVGYFFGEKRGDKTNRMIAYIGGFAGGLFVAFGRTNWANSVEAEVYGLALALSVAIIWLTLKYFEARGTAKAERLMILSIYLALLGIGAHMTVFLVVPIAAVFFIIKKEATTRDWALICGFIIVELFLIFLMAEHGEGINIGNISRNFYFISAVLGMVLIGLTFRSINWALLIAVASVSTVMIGFEKYLMITPFAFLLLALLGVIATKYRWNLHWKSGLAIIFVGFLGMSSHLYIPIRSTQNPNIDENNPSRSFKTFIDFLDRKQYGQTSMTDRMFDRRGKWENQFGRHANMGFWSYFEEQYSPGGWLFLSVFFSLGILGMVVAIKKRLEIGLPFFTLFLICSAGLVLYMNFADGTQYDFRTTDAYQEVRNRDYFFTPAFVFFGIAMGMGISALIMIIRDKLAASSPELGKKIVYVSAILALLPGISFGHSYHHNDRSNNYIPYLYAANILDSCAENAILFTSGDNDTFPLWCMQEVYGYRTDIRVVNLSLLNTDWYAEQQQNRFNVPINLSKDQILWDEYIDGSGNITFRPKRMFIDIPRNRRQTYLQATRYNGQIVKVQDMLVDRIVLENKWENPIYFSSPPYAASPLNLRSRATATGVVYRLDRNPPEGLVDIDKGYDLYMNEYKYDGYSDASVYRDDNATGVYVTMGVNAIRIYDALLKNGDTTRAMKLAGKIINVYPEYWQTALLLTALYDVRGDSTKGDSILQLVHDTLKSFSESNPENMFYSQDLGLIKVEISKRNGDALLYDEGLKLLWDSFKANANNTYSFRKLVAVLQQKREYQQIQRAALMHSEYKRNLDDPFVRQILGATGIQIDPIRR